jgi:hypothetical protein
MFARTPIWSALIESSPQVEILTLRHQLNVLRRKSPQRLTFISIDRLVFAGLYRLAPGVLDALKIVRPETVIRWHRAGFRPYWRWKSRPSSGRPKTLCLSQIKSEHIGDAVRPGPDGKEYARLCEHGVMSAHPYPTIGACVVCTENLIRVDEVMESPKLAESSDCSVPFWPSWPRHSSRSCGLKRRMRYTDIS